MKFVKMHACKNDYVYVDFREVENLDLSQLSKKLSDRKIGIGGDGLIAVGRLSEQTAFMKMYNSDGSEGDMCGNGVRCSAYFAKKHLGLSGDNFTVITKTRPVKVSLFKRDNKNYASANLGLPKLVDIDKNFFNQLAKSGLYVDKTGVFKVNVGNEHLVVFTHDFDLLTLNEHIKKTSFFKNGVNLERVYDIKFNSKNEVTLFAEVYERGSGKTLSCGSGAVAVALAYTRFNNNGCFRKKINVVTEGGVLTVNFEEGNAILTGEIKEVFRGEIDEI